MEMTPREKHVVAHNLLLHPNQIKDYWWQKRWEELAAAVEYAKTDVPTALAKTDPRLYRLLREGVTEFHLRGFDQLQLPVLRRLASQSL